MAFLDRFSLRTKILGMLFLTLAVSIGSVLLGAWHYQRSRLIDMYLRNARDVGLTVEASLRDGMLRKDRDSIQKIIDQICGVSNVSQISLVNTANTIINSTDAFLAGTRINPEKDASCRQCHANSGQSKAESPMQPVVAEFETDNGPVLRTILKIQNSPDCHGCHLPSQKINGVLLVDSSLTEIYGLLHTITTRIIITGVLTFLVIIVCISLIITRFVSSPLQTIMDGIKRIEAGDFDKWVDMENRGEFSDMATSFNVMQRAIRRYMIELQLQSKEITTLYTIVQRMSETIEIKKVKAIIINLISEVFKAEHVVLVLPPEQRDYSMEIIWKKINEKHYRALYSLESDSQPNKILHKEELMEWLDGDVIGPLFKEKETKAIIPLRIKEMQLGLLVVNKVVPAHFSMAEKKIIPALTHHIAISLANARLYSLAITDELTALYTKRHFLTKILELEERFRSRGVGFCVLMIDLDYFKDVNDNYGHVIGDKVLADVAKLLKDGLRQGDIPCRYGGEEFVILLPGSNLEASKKIALRLHKNVTEHVFRYDDYAEFHQTISIGISCCPAHATSWEELVMMADSALYRAKKGGRNMIYINPVARTEE